MGLMASVVYSHETINAYHWLDRKRLLFPSQNISDNTNWESEAVHVSLDEDAIIKATCRANAPLNLWGCTYSTRYHEDRLYTYSNFPNKMDPEAAERTKWSIQ